LPCQSLWQAVSDEQNRSEPSACTNYRAS
jgi:hypothetical protein